jgi:DNA-binding MarR family transcriptional regulator
MLFVRDFPDEAMLLDISRRFNSMDPRAVRACLALGLTTRDMRESFERFLSQYGLSNGRFLVLAVMFRTPDEAVSPSSLAHGVGVTRATMTGLLDGLERDGLVTRADDAEDRRKKLVRLTPQGQELIQRVLPEHSRRTTRFAACLTCEEWVTLTALLARIQSGIEAFENIDK